MNQTKKITQGAMMLAILGAMILLDRVMSFLFTELIVLIVPVILIMYSCMNTFKDGLVLSVGIIILSFILGNFNMTYLIYTPVGIVTGIVYSYGLSKGKDRTTLLFYAIVTYVIGEIASYYIIMPVLGFPIQELLTSYKESINQVTSVSGVNYEAVLGNVGINLDKYIIIMVMLSTILMGIMEGLLIHILSVFLLKRFKIRDIGTISLWDIKPNPVVAYVSFLSMFFLNFAKLITNETVYYICVTITIVGAMVLIYYAYLFFMLYGAIVLKKRFGGLIVILCLFLPPLMIMLMIVGFLYGSGPLRRYLENKRNQIVNG